MNLVKQRGLFDCATACLATATNNDYETIQKIIGFDTNEMVIKNGEKLDTANGLSELEVNMVLFKLNIANISLISKEFLVDFSDESLIDRWNKSIMLTSDQIRQVIITNGVDCIIEVASDLNTKLHTVVYDATKRVVVDLAKEVEFTEELLLKQSIMSATFIKPNMHFFVESIARL